MDMVRWYSKAIRRIVLAALVVCAGGCWEKIDYKGPRTVQAAPRKDTTAAEHSEGETATAAALATATTEGTQAVASDSPPSVETPSVAASPAEPVQATVPPAATTATASASSDAVGDRYAAPAPTPRGSLYGDPTPPSATDAAAATPAVEAAATPPADATPSTAATTTTTAEPPVATSPTAPPPSTATELPVAAAAPPHTDATATSASVATEPQPRALNSRRAAWLLGSRLSVAALANDRGVAPNSVPSWLADARSAASYLKTTINDLPEPAAPAEGELASRQVINYLVANGQRIGRELSKQHSAQESALFEIALKSNILLLLYTPDSSAGGSIAEAVTKAAPQAKLPGEYWQPLVTALQKKAPQADVRVAVRKMHVDVDAYLASPAELRGQ